MAAAPFTPDPAPQVMLPTAGTLRNAALGLLLLPALLCAQVPQALEFQGVARGAGGNVLPSRPITLRLGILTGSASGTLAYQETQATVTSPFGLFTVQVGTGTPVAGTFAAVPWATAPHFLKVELDTAGGSNFQLMGTSQLLSVPYALVAGSTPCYSVSMYGDTLHQGPGCHLIIPGISAANGGCSDVDGDTYYSTAGCGTAVDCNDTDAAVHPGATEVCDAADNDCDGQVDEGFDLGTDLQNCGTCGNACALPNANAICVNGLCQIGSCATGFADCDGNAANGCETNVLTDLNNCGTCGQSAVDGLQCTADVCINGVISHPPLPAGTPCTQDGGTVCNGAGACTP